MSVQQHIEAGWYKGAWWLWLLLPLTLLFSLITSARRALYRAGLLSQQRVSALVVVVGNISVGGNGKTPVVIAIAEHLLAKGLNVGVLSRGYGGQQQNFPYRVTPKDSALLVGDEPALLANRLACPVVIDPNRPRGAQALVDQGVNVVVCDDGMQHYPLARDVEIVVMDERALGNGWLLPMGPLREPRSRLADVDCIVKNGDFDFQAPTTKQHSMRLNATRLVNVADPTISLSIEAFNDRYESVVAACAIGNPSRFFDSLAAQNISVKQRLSFADHHGYSDTDLPRAPVVMTEKDAVKCHTFSHDDWWYMRVDAALPTDFYSDIDSALARNKIQ